MIPGIDLGLFTLHYYGMIIALGGLAGAIVASFDARRRGQDPEFLWDSLIWVLLGGLVGARLWHVFTPPSSMVARGLTTQFYLENPLEILMIWNGGMGIPGAVIAGCLVLYLVARRRGVSFATWLDIAAPAVALGQAIGRWGNFVNQELYGAPTDLPWAIFIDEAHRLPEYKTVAYYHPLFLYESLWNLGNLFLLLWLGRRFSDRLKPGDIALVYMIVYPVGRFLLEFLRLDASRIGGFNANQTLMAAAALTGAVLLVIRHLRRA